MFTSTTMVWSADTEDLGSAVLSLLKNPTRERDRRALWAFNRILSYYSPTASSVYARYNLKPMSAHPIPRAYGGESYREKATRKFKENPWVPIGTHTVLIFRTTSLVLLSQLPQAPPQLP